MNFKDFFSKSPRNNVIRPVRFSLKMKITVLVFIILILTVSIISNFIIRIENEVLQKQQQETMGVYLETFRKNLEVLAIQKNDREALNDFIASYKNIKNFEMAMFVDNSGRIVIHTDPDSIGLHVAPESRHKFNQAIEQKATIDSYERKVEDLPEVALVSDFENNVLKKISNSKDKEFIQGIYRKDIKENKYRLKNDLKRNERKKANELLTELGYLKWKGYDGFMPVYHPVFRSSNPDAQKIKRAIQTYKDGQLFKFDPYADEVKNNFQLIKTFNTLTKGISVLELYPSKNKNKKTVQQTNLNADDLTALKRAQGQFREYLSGEEIIIKDKDIFQLVEALKKLGLPKEKATAILVSHDMKFLFSHKELLSKPIRNTMQFLSFLDSYIHRYIDAEGKTTDSFKKMLNELNGGLTGAVKGEKGAKYFTDEYEYDNLENLSKFYRNALDALLTGNSLDKAEIEGAFADLAGIYRLGTVRIVLDMDRLLADEKIIMNNTVDIAVMVIFRILIMTFLIVSLLIAPIGQLAGVTDELAKGNLNQLVSINTNDEIGQLADKFNLMTRNLKKAFEEVKDKARMESELQNAKEIQEAILPKIFPDFKNFSFSAYYQPQSESGGDYYDFIEVDDTHFGMVVADVTGHGVGAGIVMAMLRSALRTYSKSIDASKVIKNINPILYRDTLPTMFATVFYGVVDTEKKELFYTLAGHNQCIIYNSKDSKLQVSKPGGMPVGMVDSGIFDPSIELFKISLSKGDIFIQYSDGITEAKSKNNEEYGDERFYAAIKKYADTDLDKMRDGIIADVKKFVGGAEQSDDITLLLMRVS